MAQHMYEAILQHEPNNVDALHLLGVLHNSQQSYEIGIDLIQRALSLAPYMPEAHYNLGNAFKTLRRYQESISCYDECIVLMPAHKNAWLNKGDVYRNLQNLSEAEGCYRQALQLDPENAHLHIRLGSVCRFSSRFAEAIEHYRRALIIAPDSSEAHFQMANVLFEIKLFEKALTHYRHAITMGSKNSGIADAILTCALKTCNWSDQLLRPEALSTLRDKLISPFTTLLISSSGGEQLHFARQFATSMAMKSFVPYERAARPMKINPRRIRIGYLSADFMQHATAFLIAELFEIHDREKYEIIGISIGSDDGSAVRQRIVNSFDTFLDVADVDDETAAQRIATAGVDILVDLKGYTLESRVGILRLRPAPVIVSYLGYPGTMGTPLIDYVLADAITLPFSDQKYYDEKIVHLPGCYQVNDSKVEVDSTVTTRLQHDLPQGAFVFCCFNGSQKITQLIFSAWMRILAAVPHGVLWLYHDNDSAVFNMRRFAGECGINPNRLIFARNLAHAKHLARYRHVDLFLDTSPYNAHTTASDALRAGVPVLTVRGSTFSGRVASSLLQAIGVPELIAEDLSSYEAEAYKLASDSSRLDSLRERIVKGVHSGPLFNTDYFARNLEFAYRHMYKIAAAGSEPRSFAITCNGEIEERQL